MEDRGMKIQWYPGHMAKARRMIEENMKIVDVVCEIIDARVPESSRNPEVEEMTRGKPRLIIMNRVDLADPGITREWRAEYKRRGEPVIETDSKSGKGIQGFTKAVGEAVRERKERLEARGQVGGRVRAMVIGIPNVGKSTFINRVARRKAAAVSDRPGVTRGKQWINVDKTLELLDTPGILWPRLEGGEKLAYTGAIKDTIMDTEELAWRLAEQIWERYPSLMEARYKIDNSAGGSGRELIERMARKRGFLKAGAEVDTERMSMILLDEYRGGVIGRMTLERPGEVE